MYEENKSKFAAIYEKTNKYKSAAKLIGLLLILIGIFVSIVGIFFAVTALDTDYTELPKVLQNVSQLKLAALAFATFFIIALVLVFVGIEILVLYGKEYKQDRLGAKTIVGCLSITGLGCLLWGILAFVATSATGYVLATGELSTIEDQLVGLLSFLVFVLVIWLIDVFVWFFYVKLSPKERENILTNHLDDIREEIAFRNSLPELISKEKKELLNFKLLRLEKTTLNVLKKLDANRKGRLLQSLYNLDLIRRKSEFKILLHGADFKHAHLQGLNLVEAELEKINFEQADFSKADLREANLKEANLNKANLLRTNLEEANLLDVKVCVKSLKKAASLKNATLDDRIKKSLRL